MTIKHLPHGSRCAACVIGGCASTRRVPQSLGFMENDGRMDSGVLLVAESLGHHEALQNKALVGPAGFLMGRTFQRRRVEWLYQDGMAVLTKRGDWGRDEFHYTNCLRCQPAGGDEKLHNKIRDLRGHYWPWAEEALAHCYPYLDETIERMAPKAIVALGNTAFHQLTGRTDLSVDDVRGYVFRERKGRTWVVPTHHPSYLLRGNQYLCTTLAWDVDKARHIAEQGYAEERIECVADPPLEVWDAYITDLRRYTDDQPTPVVALDIETPYKRGKNEGELSADPSQTILDISLAFEADRGVTVPWKMPYLVGVDRILTHLRQRGPARVAIWNRSYDRPRLQRHLSTEVLPIEQTVDTMDQWHVLYNHLDRGLAFATSCFPLGQHGIAAWKHLGQQDATYRVMDSVALWRNHQAIVALQAATHQTPVANLFLRDLDPILEEMTMNGVLVDVAMRDQVTAQLGARLRMLKQGMAACVPTSLQPVKVWQTRHAAERGLQRLQQVGAVGPEEGLEDLTVMRAGWACSQCGEVGVKTSHVTRKTLPTVTTCPALF